MGATGDKGSQAIPTQLNLDEIVKSMKGMSAGISALVDPIKSITSSLADLSKNAKDLKTSAKSIEVISNVIAHTGSLIEGMVKGIQRVSDEFSKDQIKQLVRAWVTTETVHPEKNDKGFITSSFTTKNPSLIDVINGFLGINMSLDSIKIPNPAKFTVKFQGVIGLLKYMLKNLVKIGQEFDAGQVKKTYQTMDALMNCASILPMITEQLSQGFVKAGKNIAAVGLGMLALVGEYALTDKGRIGGMLGVLIGLGNSKEVQNLNSQTFDELSKFAKSFSIMSKLLVVGFVMLAVTGPIVAVGVLVYYIVVRAIVAIAKLLDKNEKSINKGNKELLIISGAVALFAMTAALLALTGIMIVKGWAMIGMTLALLAGIVVVALALNLLSRPINQGIKEYLIIAGTIALFALTAVLIVFLGQYIEGNWDSILKTGAMLAILVGAFMALGALKKPIDQGGKEMIKMAGVIAILAGTAVALVFISNLIQGNWEGIAMIGTVMALLTGMFIGVGFAAKLIDQGNNALMKMCVTMIVVTGVLGALAYIVMNTNLLKLVAGIVMMTAIIVIFAGATIGLGALIVSGVGAAVYEAGIGAMIELCIPMIAVAGTIGILAAAVNSVPMGKLVAGFGLMIGLVVSFAAAAASIAVISPLVAIGAAAMMLMSVPMNAIAVAMVIMSRAIKNIASLGLDPEETLEQAMIPVLVMKSVVKKLFGLNVIEMAKAAYNANMLAGITCSVGRMGKTLSKIAKLRMPVEFDKNGNPTKWETMKADDFKTAALNAHAVLQTVVAMFADEDTPITVNGEEKTIQPIKMDSIKQSLLWARIRMGVLGSIVNVLGDMAKTVSKIARLSLPMFDKDGKQVGERLMTPNDFKDAACVAGGLMSFFALLVGGEGPQSVEMGNFQVDFNSLSTSVLENITKDTKKKVELLGKIVSPIGDMARVIQEVANLTIPIYDEKTGQEKGKRTMVAADFVSASNACGLLISFFAALFGEKIESFEVGGEAVSIEPVKMTWLESLQKKTAKKMELLDRILSPVGKLAATVKDMAQLRIPKYDPNTGKQLEGQTSSMSKKDIAEAAINTHLIVKAMAMALNIDDDLLSGATGNQKSLGKLVDMSKDVGKLVSSLMDVTSKMDGDSLFYVGKDGEQNLRLGLFLTSFNRAIFDNIGDNADKKAAAFSRVSKSTISMLTKIDKMDINKLKYAYSLVSKLNDFSRSINGNFDKLAKTINENLIEALKKLQETLQETQDTIKKAPRGTKTVVQQVGGGSNSNTNVEVPDLSGLIGQIENLVTQLSDDTKGLTVRPAKNSVWPET